MLTAFSENRRTLRLTDVAEITALPVATAYRMLRTLEAAGWIDRLPDGSFRPGVAVLRLGFAALQGLTVVDVSAPARHRLAAATRETVNLGVLIDTEVLYLDRIPNSDLVTANVHVGSLLPAECTSMGKLLLACLEPHECDARLATIDLRRCAGPNAVRSRPLLRRQLDQVRLQGWAMQDEEVAAGLRSIAAPIRDHLGAVTAAVNVAVQSARWPAAQLVEDLLPPLLEACADASARLAAATPAPAQA